jgi:hypothetical protein
VENHRYVNVSLDLPARYEGLEKGSVEDKCPAASSWGRAYLQGLQGATEIDRGLAVLGFGVYSSMSLGALLVTLRRCGFRECVWLESPLLSLYDGCGMNFSLRYSASCDDLFCFSEHLFIDNVRYRGRAHEEAFATVLLQRYKNKVPTFIAAMESFSQLADVFSPTTMELIETVCVTNKA